MPLQHELIELLNPERTALLVIDVQHAYCDPEEVLPRLLKSDTDEIQAMIPRLGEFIEKARGYGIEPVWTRMIEDPNLSRPNLRLKMQIEGTPAISTSDTPGFEYYKIRPQKGDKEIVKKGYNAFTGTDLHEYLKSKGKSTIVVTGAYTGRCVDATVIVASDVYHYHVFVPRDLIGSLGVLADEQRVIPKRVQSVFGYVIDSKDILYAWGKHKAKLL